LNVLLKVRFGIVLAVHLLEYWIRAKGMECLNILAKRV